MNDIIDLCQSTVDVIIEIIRFSGPIGTIIFIYLLWNILMLGLGELRFDEKGKYKKFH